MPNSERKYEIRSFGAEAAPKVLRSADGKETRMIEGYAIVFNQRSQLLFDWNSGRPVYEIIDAGAVDEAFLRSCDIQALLEHNINRMLARSRNGAGSLSLSIDQKGVKYNFEAPNTADGDYAVEEVRRGDLFGSSFAYLTDEDVNVSYSKEGDNLIRTVKKIDQMFDVSIVSNPAYMGTSVEARSVQKRFLEKPINDDDKKDDAFASQLKELRNLQNIN
jgi:uncharacterized protein